MMPGTLTCNVVTSSHHYFYFYLYSAPEQREVALITCNVRLGTTNVGCYEDESYETESQIA